MLTDVAPSAGGHGFPPGYPELHASFIASGPGIDAGRNLGVIRMTQVGPTLAELLGVRLAPGADAPLTIVSDATP